MLLRAVAQGEPYNIRDTVAAARSTTSLRNNSSEPYLQDPSELSNIQEFSRAQIIDPISPNPIPLKIPRAQHSYIHIGLEQTEHIRNISESYSLFGHIFNWPLISNKQFRIWPFISFKRFGIRTDGTYQKHIATMAHIKRTNESNI